VIDDPGRLRVDHGFDCAQASRGATRDYIGIRVQNRAAIPEGYDATVFMNGWHANYTSKDHEVLGLGSIVFNIDRQGNDLTWEAGGVIADKNGDDGYRWCYQYTLLFWPASSFEFDIHPVHSNLTGQLLFLDDNRQDRAVHSIPGWYGADGDDLPRAVLPSGFAMLWTQGTDHNILQLGYDLGEASLSGNTVSWTSRAAFKDNKSKRPFYAAEAVTILSGHGFSVTHPGTVLRQSDDGGWELHSNAERLTPRSPTDCASAELGNPTHVRHFAITGLQSRYAVPMLNGWELRYNCDDQHVRSAGAAIEDFHYDPPANGGTGTLYYTIRSTLADKNGTPGFLDWFEVSVLGITPLSIHDGTFQPPVGGVLQP
jgi:hypothetical protein